MSSFICSEKTRSVVAKLISEELYNLNGRGPMLVRDCDKYRDIIDTCHGKHVDKYKHNTCQIIFDLLTDLNYDGVNSTYKEQNEVIHTKFNNPYTNIYSIETFKRLQCFMYQSCSVQNVYLKDLYKLLKHLENELAKYLISETEEYNNVKGWE